MLTKLKTNQLNKLTKIDFVKIINQLIDKVEKEGSVTISTTDELTETLTTINSKLKDLETRLEDLEKVFKTPPKVPTKKVELPVDLGYEDISYGGDQELHAFVSKSKKIKVPKVSPKKG